MVPGSGTLVIEQHLDVGSEADHRYDSTEARFAIDVFGNALARLVFVDYRLIECTVHRRAIRDQICELAEPIW
jgi:hypothetical protein